MGFGILLVVKDGGILLFFVNHVVSIGSSLNKAANSLLPPRLPCPLWVLFCDYGGVSSSAGSLGTALALCNGKDYHT